MLLLDLLSGEKEHDRANVLDVALLSRILVGTTACASQAQPGRSSDRLIRREHGRCGGAVVEARLVLADSRARDVLGSSSQLAIVSDATHTSFTNPAHWRRSPA